LSNWPDIVERGEVLLEFVESILSERLAENLLAETLFVGVAESGTCE